MPVSRVSHAGSSNCQLSNDARISLKMPVSLKNTNISQSMAEPAYITLDSIELKRCNIVTDVVNANGFNKGGDFSLSIQCGGVRSCH